MPSFSSSSESDEELPSRRSESRSQLKKSLKHAQLERQELETKNATLERDFAAAHTQLTQLRGSGRRKKTISTLPYVDAIRTLGKRFCVVGFPWPEDHVFDLTPLPEEVLAANPLARFESEQSYERAAAGDLLAYVPEQYHDDMLKGVEFRRLFKHYANDQRSLSITALARDAGILFGKPSSIFKDRKYKRSGDPDIDAYLRQPGEKKYHSMAPILFSDHRVEDEDTLFLSNLLVLALRLILFHQTELRGAPSMRTVGMMWRIKSVTPPMIAMAAIMLRYIVSDDTEFKKVGAISKITYYKDFRTYQRWLVKNADTPHGEQIFTFFNTHVFADIWDGEEESEEEPNLSAEDSFEAALATRFGKAISMEELEDDDQDIGNQSEGLEFDDEDSDEPDNFFANYRDARATTDHTTTAVNDTSIPSSSGIVPAAARTPNIETATPSPEALMARPRGPPAIVRAQPASAKAVTPLPPRPTRPVDPPVPSEPVKAPSSAPHSGPSTDQATARSSGRRGTGSRSVSGKPDVLVLSTVVEESQSSTSKVQTRRSTRTSSQTVTTTSLSGIRPTVNVGATEDRGEEGAPKKTKKGKGKGKGKSH
ncbi:hypothetical protein HWV62_40124 [Athelia sp. TMB]|nr:hypothetical protein HWV62_40124 [Athelia sp. TMB]